MTITLDEKYNAKTDIATLGYVGETNARIITFVGYQCEGADNYKMRFKYADGVTYDVDISGGTYTIDGSILRCVGAVYVQILACKQNGDTYEYVKKSNILTLQIGRSLNGEVAPVPTYEQSVEALEKVLAAEESSAENAQKSETASNAAQAAQNAAQAAKETVVEFAANAEKAAENAAQSETAAQTAADTATDKAAEISESAEQIQQNTADIAKLYNKSDGIVCSAQGAEITLNDSSDLPFSGMRVFGRSEQLTTTGAQLLNIKQSGLPGQLGDITLTVNADGSITVTGDYTTPGGGNVFTHFLGEYIDLLEDGKTYATRDCHIKVVENGVNRWWAKFTVDKSTMTSIQPYLQLSGKEYYSGITIYPMLNVGKTAMPFEPYTGGQPSPSPDYPQEIVSGDSGNVEINVQGENLLPDRNITSRGVSISVSDGVLKMVGTVDDTNSTLRIYWASTNLKNILTPGKTYYLWCDNPNIHFRFLESNISHNDVSNYTVTGNETDLLVCFILGDSPQAEGEKIDVTARVSLTECKPQTMTISTPNGLPGIPVTSGGNYTDENGQQWICDEIDFERGVYVQRILAETLTSFSKVSYETENMYNYQSTLSQKAYGGSKYIALGDKLVYAYNRGDTQHFYVNNNTNIIDVFLPKNMDVTTFELAILAVLCEPYETPLTDDEIAAYKSLHTNKPTTVITNSDSAHMAVNYTADTKTYIDNKFAELATAIVATGGDT